jgi:putative ABC transport system permease protein
VTWSAAVQGVGIGVLVSLLFSVVPLLHVRFIKPSLLLRDETVSGRTDWAGMAAMAGVASALVALAAWQAASIRIGVVLCVGFAGLALVLHRGLGLVAHSPAANSRPGVVSRWVLARLSRSLTRPGSQRRHCCSCWDWRTGGVWHGWTPRSPP